MVIDVVSLVCIVSGVIGCIISCGVKFKGEDRNKLIYGWLMEAILRILLVMAVLICFGNDSSDCFAYGIGKIIPVWVTAIALVTDFALLYGFTYKMSGMAEKYLLYVLPAMQMNIDKEINSGQISEIEANQQRNNLVEWGLFRSVFVTLIKCEKYECLIYLTVNIVINVLLMFQPNSMLVIWTVGISTIISLSLLLNIAVWWVISRRSSDECKHI